MYNHQSVKKSKANNKPKRTNIAVSIPRNRFTYMLPTDQFRVALKYSGTVSIAANTFLSDSFGVCGPGARIPKYWNEFFGIYKNCYIESVSFQFQISESNNRPLRVVVAESNSADVTPTSYLELAETPRSIQKQVIAGGNQSVVHIHRKTSAKAIMGHTLEDDDDYWNTQAAGPTAGVVPLLVLGYEPIVPLSVCQVNYQVMIIYNLKYFTLNHL